MGTTDDNAVVTIPLSGTFINNGAGTTTITDADANAVIGGIALTGVTGNGTWEYSLDGKTFTAVGTVGIHSALLLDKNAVLRYIPDGTGELASISYQAWDTTFGQDGSPLDLTLSAATSPDSPVSTASDTAWLTVNDVTDAVVLTPANPMLGSTTSSSAATISLAGTFIDNGTGTTTITDSNPSGVLGGIALTGVSGSGAWTYSLNGTDFTSVGTVSASAALLLPSTAELRYTPSGTVSETATITYLAWDATSGAAGDQPDLSSAGATGGTTAFSLATDTASLLVNTCPGPDPGRSVDGNDRRQHGRDGQPDRNVHQQRQRDHDDYRRRHATPWWAESPLSASSATGPGPTRSTARRSPLWARCRRVPPCCCPATPDCATPPTRPAAKRPPSLIGPGTPPAAKPARWLTRPPTASRRPSARRPTPPRSP